MYMLVILTNDFITTASYVNDSLFSGFAQYPAYLYLFSVFWVISTVLSSTLSTRVNNQTSKFRSNINASVIRLYKL
jgi:hypothetical protein